MSIEEAIAAVKKAYRQYHPEVDFEPGKTFIPHAGKVLGDFEIETLTRAVVDGWLTTGPFADEFEKQIQNYLGIRSATLVNSGSSANLAAISALTSNSLGERSIKPGDEVITVAAGFPTTINPIIQIGAVPVFIDITIPSYNLDTTYLEEALTNKTKAIVIAHTLGNPFDLDIISEFAKKNNLWLIEDNCDSLGSKFNDQFTGTFGDLSTLSFYPAHHITTGEGGAVLTKSPKLRVLVESFRDWGRDCYCAPGKDNTCLKRFSQQCGKLPFGYDHKFVYSHIGYNLKMTDLQASVGLAQMKSLANFVSARKKNWNYLKDSLSSLEDFLILPEFDKRSEPSWFGFAVTLRQNANLDRQKILEFFASKNIGTRLLFAGNILKQPSMVNVAHKQIGNLKNTNVVMEDTFWVGVWPGLKKEQLDYIVENFFEIKNKFSNFKK